MPVPRTALHDLIARQPLARATDANFKKMTVTFELRPGQVTAPGEFALVPESAIVAAFQADGQYLHLLPNCGNASMDWRLGVNDLGVEVNSDSHSSVMYFDRCSDPTAKYPRKPLTWWGREQRIDAHGRSWARQFESLVMDNFGDLVEVAE